MKTRLTFVSNSSSSSYTCNVCGETQSGMNMCASDCGMYRCVNEHYYCERHQVSNVSTNQIQESFQRYLKQNDFTDRTYDINNLTKDEIVDIMDSEYDGSNILDCYCPICMFSKLDISDGYEYLKLKFKLTNKEILNNIKNDFKSYSEFSDFITKNSKWYEKRN